VETEDAPTIGRFGSFWIAYDCGVWCWLAGGVGVLAFLFWQAGLIVPMILGILAVVCTIATALRKGEDFQGDRGVIAFGAVIFLVLAVFWFGVWSGRHEQRDYQVGCDNGDQYDCRHLVP